LASPWRIAGREDRAGLNAHWLVDCPNRATASCMLFLLLLAIIDRNLRGASGVDKDIKTNRYFLTEVHMEVDRFVINGYLSESGNGRLPTEAVFSGLWP
jgi:hypothetical protein